ncbi:hypothetical protein X777_05305 [Ooceraea biroi]|uniref:Uncharacterized protein n=1 Tax=Ooceraea biroi TaxID=2015173 RepID=A0A026WGF7_OOCBI|nr:hypothetical protein X777_05305 [Ooceraea biroi]
MEQTGRNKTKYTSPHTSTWSTKQTTDARVPPDAYWKYTQRSNQDATDKSTRRHQSPMPESTVSYYSSANSYKTSKHHSYPRSTHPKQTSALHMEAPQRYQQTTMKSNRNKDYISNIAVLNKDRHKDQQENENDARYIDEEPGNFTEDNLEDDPEEEAENDQETIGELFNKEYDEQEADDEVDEESDAPAESHEAQRDAAKKDALRRAQQRLQIINQQQDPHRIRYQHSSKSYQAHPLATRYYHRIPDHDIHEALSEEDLYATQILKNPPRRSSAGYYQNWITQRNSADRYDTMTSTTQPSHRVQTRPELKSFAEAEFVDRRKCSRCGNVSVRKLSTSRRDNGRFQNNPNFSTKEHFNDGIEILDQSWCGNCKPKHHLDETTGTYESPSPQLYSMKPRRSRDINIPMHETLEGKHMINELSHEYARIPPRYTKDMPNISRDKIKRSVQTTQGVTKMPIRYDP